LRLIPPGAGNHQRYQHTGHSQPMGGGPYPRRRDVSPDPCRPAAVTESAHRHSPQQTGRGGPAARGPQKSLNAGTATAPMAVTEPNRSQSPRCPCKAPPKSYHPMVRLRRGDGSRLFVASAVDWFKCDGENGKLGDVSKLTKWSPAGMGSGDGGKPQVHRRHFSPPGCGPAYPTTAARRRPELARQLNHWPGSATNE
jgi:hypothetical protein